jgi:outer membrane biosynthesis protein TonB
MNRCVRVLRAAALSSFLTVLWFDAAGCARAKAKTVPDAPALDMPAPPPRDVELTETEPPPPATLPSEPARATTPRPRPAPPTAPRTNNNEPARNEAPKPAEAAPPPVEIRPAEEAPRPPTTLQTTPAQAEGEVERTIRATLTRATSDLNRIDYRVLNADARVQYDTAKSFLRQADQAIRAKNLVFAKNLADKAAALATQLGGK